MRALLVLLALGLAAPPLPAPIRSRQQAGAPPPAQGIALVGGTDLVAVHGDPLRHSNILRDPVVVIRHGRRYR